MRRPVQEVSGALARAGAQPVDNSGRVADALGAPDDEIAEGPGSGTINAKLGAMLIALSDIRELVACMVERFDALDTRDLG